MLDLVTGAETHLKRGGIEQACAICRAPDRMNGYGPSTWSEAA
ncbi:hypothetical protein [Streptomyces sp. DT203]